MPIDLVTRLARRWNDPCSPSCLEQQIILVTGYADEQMRSTIAWKYPLTPYNRGIAIQKLNKANVIYMLSTYFYGDYQCLKV